MPASTALATVLGVTAATTPAAEPSLAPSESSAPTYTAIAVNLVEDGERHDLKIVEIEPDGTEQLVRLISHDFLPNDLDFSGYAQVSQASGSRHLTRTPDRGAAGTLFVDLADSSSISRYVDGLLLGGRWSPTGSLYVDQQSGVGTVVIDPSTGTI